MSETRQDILNTMMDGILSQVCDGAEENGNETVKEKVILDKSGAKLLVLVCGGRGGASEAAEQLRMLSERFDLKVILSDAAKEVLGDGWIASAGIGGSIASESESAIGLMMEADAIVVPVMTVNTAAKVACGIADNAVTAALVHALLCGKPVIAADAACDPWQYPAPCQTVSGQMFRRRLGENINRLREYGVRLTSAGELCSAVLQTVKAGPGPAVTPARPQTARPVPAVSAAVPDAKTDGGYARFGGKVLGAGDLRNWQYSVIMVSPETVITPSAKDTLKERGIQIVEEG